MTKAEIVNEISLKTGAEVIPCQFDYAGDFSEGLAIVEINKNKGFIDKTGKIVIPCKYRMVRNFSEGLACVFIDKWEFIDKVGRTIITCGSGAFSFFEGLAAIFKNEGDKTDFIDKSGRTVFSTSMRSYKFSEGLAATYNGNVKIGYIDKTGEIVIPNIFEEYCALYHDYNLCDFSNGLALVKDSNWSRYFINKKGETVLPPDKYRDLRPFHDGLACVNGGYIDNKGNEIIPSGIFYNQDRDFSEGMTWIAIFVEGKYKYVLIKKEWFV
ncbi:MAG: WG repeat-containing protein [Bacteroides caccae]